jgi:hypothetical protein
MARVDADIGSRLRTRRIRRTAESEMRWLLGLEHLALYRHNDFFELHDQARMVLRDRGVALGIGLAAGDPLEIFVHELLEGSALVLFPPLKKIDFGLKSFPSLISNIFEDFLALS